MDRFIYVSTDSVHFVNRRCNKRSAMHNLSAHYRHRMRFTICYFYDPHYHLSNYISREFRQVMRKSRFASTNLSALWLYKNRRRLRI